MQAPGIVPFSGLITTTTVQTELVRTKSQSDTTVQKLGSGYTHSDLVKLGTSPGGTTAITTTWVTASSQIPMMTTSATSLALPTMGGVQMKARKLKGYSGGKEETWELYRTKSRDSLTL
jgi:hypothetical protein